MCAVVQADILLVSSSSFGYCHSPGWFEFASGGSISSFTEH